MIKSRIRMRVMSLSSQNEPDDETGRERNRSIRRQLVDEEWAWLDMPLDMDGWMVTPDRQIQGFSSGRRISSLSSRDTACDHPLIV